MSNQCKYCETIPKSWNGDNRNCAFKDGTFTNDNWNCASMNFLRSLAEEKGHRQYGEDISCATLCIPEFHLKDDEWISSGFCVLSWYKNRGCTSNALYISDEVCEPLRFEMVDAILKHYNVYHMVKETKV